MFWKFVKVFLGIIGYLFLMFCFGRFFTELEYKKGEQSKLGKFFGILGFIFFFCGGFVLIDIVGELTRPVIERELQDIIKDLKYTIKDEYLSKWEYVGPEHWRVPSTAIFVIIFVVLIALSFSGVISFPEH